VLAGRVSRWLARRRVALAVLLGLTGFALLSPGVLAPLASAGGQPVAHIAASPCCGVRGGTIVLLPGSVTAADLAAGSVGTAALSPAVIARLNPVAASAASVDGQPVAHAAGAPCCGVKGGKIYLLPGAVTSADLAGGSVGVAALSSGVSADLNPAGASSASVRGDPVTDGAALVRRHGKLYLRPHSIVARDFAKGAVRLAALKPAVVARLNTSAKGNVQSWGDNASGDLGDGLTPPSSTPVAVSKLSGVIAVAAGGDHSLALLSNGTVEAWGSNAYGELGDGSTTASSTPVAVSGLSGVTAIAAGGSHSLALLSNGTVEAWGQNNNGELGNGATADSSTPVAVSGLSGVTAVAAGDNHSLALLSNGTVVAWGQGGIGQLGDGTTSDSATPVAVSGLSGVTAIAAGAADSVALLTGGTVETWGDNDNGELGNGSTLPSSSTPVAVSGLSGVTAIAAGDYHDLAVLSNGTVDGWGYNDAGQLGNASTTSSSTPVAVSGLTGVTAITAGVADSFALLSSGTVEAWGYNSSGQLGDASTTNHDTPVAVSDLTDVKAIAAGDYHTLALHK
jgi:alpha-tubulin suppressor-like RCC1 family protein